MIHHSRICSGPQFGATQEEMEAVSFASACGRATVAVANTHDYRVPTVILMARPATILLAAAPEATASCDRVHSAHRVARLRRRAPRAHVAAA